jgi:hypothetical protein
MNRFIVAKSRLLITLIIIFSAFSFASKKKVGIRNIDLAGLVVNAQTLSPIESAKIYDSDGKLLGTTDKNGYYNVRISYGKSGEMYFKVKIVKEGFHDFVQNEHWGDLGDTRKIMYFGLKASHSNVSSFSTFGDSGSNSNDLSYDGVISHFDKVKAQKDFNDKLENVKAGNEDVLVQIDGSFYIVDNSGWIKLNTDKDLVSVDDRQMLTADKLNSSIKRKDVKWMTPLDKKGAKFAIYTRKK